MGFFIDISIGVTEMLTLIIGISGIVLSVLLLFHPRLVEKLSRLLNYRFDTDWILPFLNRRVPVEGLAFRHHFVVGIFLLAGSLFVLNFLYFNLHLTPRLSDSGEIWVRALILIGKVSSVCGVILGAALVFLPEQVRRLESAVDTWVDTDEVVEELNRFHSSFDNIFLRHPLFFGSIGLLASFVLVILSLANLIMR